MPETGLSTLMRLRADEAAVKRLANLFEEQFGGEDVAAASFEMPPGWAFEAYFGRASDEAVMRRWVRDALDAAAADTLVFETIATRDWVKASLEGLTPVIAGRFIVHGAHSRDAIRASGIAIEIEAALAFGTGHHGTTRGCLLAFDTLLKESKPQRVLDVGTGSGVLAIAAARALRRSVRASDIDAEAVRVARVNARSNRAGGLVEALVARGVTVQRLRRDRYDLIFANILAAPLKTMAASISDLLDAGGHIILSGLMMEHAHSVLAAYRAQGLVLRRRITLDGWVTYVMRRPNPF